MVIEKKLKKIIFLILLQLFIFQNLRSETISNFIISGNERVADETVIMFSNLKVGDKINNNTLNEALKELYYTNYFKNVELSIQNQTIIIKVIENPIEKIKKIDGVSFDWKETNEPSLGVIADNVLEVLPEIVSGEDTKSVNYNGLIGVLIEVVKDQQKQIDELRGLIDK